MVISRSKNQQVMILRNPAVWRDSFFIAPLIFLLVFGVASHTKAQGIVGHVVESSSKQNIGGAEVGIYHEDSLLISTHSDASGLYTIQTEFAGRASIRIISQYYQDYIQQDIILDGYSTLREEHLLTKRAFDLPGITVVANKNRTTDFVRSIDPGDMVLVAGNFEDPVRIAHSQPGIILTNDQANHFSARGQSPVFNSWYLEGLQIVNPNHTSNAGTLSDLPTQYGGGVNMFSEQILGTTNIYVGINPLDIPNTTGAVINMHLHETAKPEWRAKAGLLGFELGGGTALGKQSVLDFNLRYSFTGLLTDLGADFGGEKIGFYDGVLSFINVGTSHVLKIFAWAGRSENEFDPPEDRKEYKDFFNIDYGNTILGTGARYDLSINSNLFLRSGFAFSTNPSSYSKYGYFEDRLYDLDIDDQISITSSFLELTFNHSNHIQSNIGIDFTSRSYKNEYYHFLPFGEENLLRFYWNSSLLFAPKWKLDVGVELKDSFWDGVNTVPGYRTQLTWALSNSNSLFAGARHSAGQLLSREVNVLSDTYELGWSLEGKKQNAGLNLYYQQMNSLNAYFLTDTAFEYLADYPNDARAGVLGTSHKGASRQVGIEGIWGFSTENGFRAAINQSVYKCTRGIKGGTLEPGRYNGQFATHISISKEIIHVKNEKNRIWNFSMRALWNGGLWEPKISIYSSDVFNETVYQYPVLFDQHLPAYKRIDASISRTISTAKIRWQYKLDIQNLFGFTNIAYHYYDPYLNEIVAQEQLGLIPVLSVQASW